MGAFQPDHPDLLQSIHVVYRPGTVKYMTMPSAAKGAPVES
jgi:hypothetical protein